MRSKETNVRTVLGISLSSACLLSPKQILFAPQSWGIRMTSSNKETEFDFERSLTELERIVQRLEGSDLSLEESLKAFEQGVALTRSCQQALANAEQRVQLLVEENGGSQARPFDGGQDDTGGGF